jgi:hypothetical protein
MMVACAQGQLEVIETLMDDDYEANLDLKDSRGRYARMFAGQVLGPHT